MRTLIHAACLTCLTLALLIVASTVRAANWTGGADAVPPNGIYNNVGNWSGNFGLVPGAADTGIFDINATYTVTFAGNQALQHATVRSGLVSWLSDSATVRSFALGRLSVGGVNQTLTIGSAAKPLAVTSSNPIEAGSLITVGNGTIVVDGASSSLGGPSVQLGGFADLDGVLRYQNGAQGAIGGQIDLGSSTYDDSNGLLEVLSGADLTSGNLVLATTPSTATGAINISGAGSTLVQSGTSTIVVGSLSGGAGTVNVTTGGSFTTGSGLTTVNATGTINRTDTGVINVTGNLLIDGGKFLTSGSNFSRGAGQTLTVQSGGLFSANPPGPTLGADAAAGATLSSAGTIGVNSGEVRVDGASAPDRFLSGLGSGAGGAGGALNITGGQMTLSGTALASGGGGYGGNMIAGAMTSGGIGGVGGTFTVSGGTMTLANQSAVSLAGGGGGTRLGAGGQSGGNGGNGGTFHVNGGSVEMNDNSSLTMHGGNGGDGDTGFGEHGGNGGTGGTLLVSAGTFTLNGGTVALLGGSGGAAGSAGAPGQVKLDGGTLTMNGGELTTGSLSSSRGAFHFNGGKLRATTVNFKLIVGGTLAPGITTGTLTVNGGYAQGPAGTLEIELGGAGAGQFDRLVTTASTTLGGALNVVITNGFVPQAGNSFNILDLAPFTGTFATLNLPGGGLTWNTSLLYLNGTISVGGVVGDYNKNGTVDAADYVVWRKTLGQTGVGLAADGNFNNIIDAGDFDVFRGRFGQTAGSGAGVMANAAVPEPSSVMLLCFVIAGYAFCREGKRRSVPGKLY